MPIPFIRGYPGGGRGLQEIERSPSVQRKANKFIANDGRYLIEILKDGKVHLVAIIDVDGVAKAVSEKFCTNDAGLMNAVDELVRESVVGIPVKALALPEMMH